MRRLRSCAPGGLRATSEREERGEQEIIERYDTFIRKSYHTIILPTREHAQVIVDGEASIDMQLATLSAAVNGLS